MKSNAMVIIAEKTHLGEANFHLILRIALFIQCRLNQARNILLLLFLQKKVFSGKIHRNSVIR